jgi:hypothetical protein
VKLLTVASGELLQRLREPAFLALLIALAAGTTYLVPSPHDSYTTLSLGNRGIFGGSALAGTSAGLDFSVFAGFFCIFALGSGFARDDRTRLSELLRAQPIRTIGLVFGRMLASWALGAALVAGGLVLLGVTLAFRQGHAFEPWPYARNFLLLALPSMCFMASFAVLLDVLLGKWRGLLIGLGLIGYVALISVAAAPDRADRGSTRAFDFSGSAAVQQEFSRAFGPKAMMNVGIDIENRPGKPLFWSGLAPEVRTVAGRGLIVAEAALLGLVAFAFYRRRAGVTIKGAKAVALRRGLASSSSVLAAAPVARSRGAIARIFNEVAFRVRQNPLLACASVGLFILALLGARAAHHWVIALAILLPLFWIRVFDDSLRPRSLDETLASLPGGLGGDWSAKFVTLAVVCALPLLGLLAGNPGEPMIWLAATAGILAEIAWLTTMAWGVRAELLAIGVVAIWWYVVAFNELPAPIDFAGLWSAPMTTVAIDAIFAVVCIATAQTLMARRR